MSDQDSADWQNEVDAERAHLAEELLADKERLVDLIVTHDGLATVLATWIIGSMPIVKDARRTTDHDKWRIEMMRLAGRVIGLRDALMVIAEDVVESDAEHAVNARWDTRPEDDV